jgi:hypothetical protein
MYAAYWFYFICMILNKTAQKRIMLIQICIPLVYAFKVRSSNMNHSNKSLYLHFVIHVFASLKQKSLNVKVSPQGLLWQSSLTFALLEPFQSLVPSKGIHSNKFSSKMIQLSKLQRHYQQNSVVRFQPKQHYFFTSNVMTLCWFISKFYKKQSLL